MSDNGVVRCPLCREAVEADALSVHLRRHSTWTIVSYSFKRWPAFTAGLLLAASLLWLVLYAAIVEVLPR